MDLEQEFKECCEASNMTVSQGHAYILKAMASDAEMAKINNQIIRSQSLIITDMTNQIDYLKEQVANLSEKLGMSYGRKS